MCPGARCLWVGGAVCCGQRAAGPAAAAVGSGKRPQRRWPTHGNIRTTRAARQSGHLSFAERWTARSHVRQTACTQAHRPGGARACASCVGQTSASGSMHTAQSASVCQGTAVGARGARHQKLPEIAAIGPKQVNRAHWPTKEKKAEIIFFVFFGPRTNWPEMAPNGARKFFPTNPDLADILGKTNFCFFFAFF